MKHWMQAQVARAFPSARMRTLAGIVPHPGSPAADPLSSVPPGAARERVEQLLEHGEKVHLILAADIDEFGQFRDSWLIVTDLRVLVLQHTERALSPGEELTLEPVREFSLFCIESALTIDFIGAGVLQLVLRPDALDDEDFPPVEIVRYSRTLSDQFDEAADLIKRLAAEAAAGLGKHADDANGEKRRRPRRRCEKCRRPFPTGNDFCPYCLDKGAVLIRLLGYLAPHKRGVALGLLLTVVTTLLGLTPPYLTKVLVDGAFKGHSFRLLWVVCVAYTARYLLGAVLTACRMQVMTVLGQDLIFDLRTHLCRHLHDLSLNYFDRRQVGGIMSRVMNDTSAINSFLVDGVQNFLVNIFTLLFIGVIMFAFNWKLALLSLAPAPVMIYLIRWFSYRITPIYRRYWGSVAAMNGALATSISGVRVVKSFAQEEREIERFSGSARSFYNTNLESNRVKMVYNPVLTVLTGIGAVLAWAYGGEQVLRGHLSIGTILMFTGYMWQFFAPVQTLCSLNDQIQSAATAGERIFQLLDTAPEVQDAPDAVTPPVQGRVEFDNVTFRYEESDSAQPVLQNVSFTAEPGQLVGLVGHSGSGKSTMVNLLLRFYDVTSGQIRIDGRDIRDLDSRGIREQLGMVLQEPFLFSGTIAENISYGQPDANMDEVIAAAKAANAHKFIVSFPDAYDTEVGERGVKLSGGEKQRVSIARAILSNPRILILDEATSAVDTETEALIQEAMERLMKGRTTLAIAHRLSTLKNADKLVVLDHGKIAESGTHEELMALEEGVYAKLVKIQTELSRNGSVLVEH